MFILRHYIILKYRYIVQSNKKDIVRENLIKVELSIYMSSSLTFV